MKTFSKFLFNYLFLLLKSTINTCLIMVIVSSSMMVSSSFAQEKTPSSISKDINNYTNKNTTTNAEEILSFDNDTQRNIYQQLIIELRCPKCQNQNIADSNADIAQDLRKKVYEMAIQNQNKTEIKQFMLDRYGEFVLYKPQFSGKTLLLWLGPILLLIFVIFFVIRIILRNAAHLTEEDSID